MRRKKPKTKKSNKITPRWAGSGWVRFRGSSSAAVRGRNPPQPPPDPIRSGLSNRCRTFENPPVLAVVAALVPTHDSRANLAWGWGGVGWVYLSISRALEPEAGRAGPGRADKLTMVTVTVTANAWSYSSGRYASVAREINGPGWGGG